MTLPKLIANWLAHRRLRSAAQQYAARLGPQLVHAYGAGERYTVDQIRTAVERARLPVGFIRIGYAAFLSEEGFRAAITQSTRSDYDALRALFRSFISRRFQAETGTEDGLGGGYQGAQGADSGSP